MIKERTRVFSDSKKQFPRQELPPRETKKTGRDRQLKEVNKRIPKRRVELLVPPGQDQVSARPQRDVTNRSEKAPEDAVCP